MAVNFGDPRYHQSRQDFIYKRQPAGSTSGFELSHRLVHPQNRTYAAASGSLPDELVECTANPLAHGVATGVSGVCAGDKFRVGPGAREFPGGVELPAPRSSAPSSSHALWAK